MTAMPHSDHHATIFVPAEVAGPVEAIRRAWDPGMAGAIAAHVTVAYPREAADVSLLVERTRLACASVRPFRLRLGKAACFGRPADGVYVDVDDVDGSLGRLRSDILRAPFRPVDFRPHVTLVHPRTSSRGADCWDAVRHRALDAEFTVGALAITAFDGVRWDTLASFALPGATR